MEAIASAKGWAPSGPGSEKFTGYEFSSGRTETADDFASVGHVETRPMTSSTAAVDDNGGGGYWKLLVQHWHATVTYCAVFWTFGLCVAFLGPTLLDLGCLTSSDLRHISWVFLAQLFCSLVGATVAGYLARKVDANHVLLVSTAVVPICMVVIPVCTALSGLAFVLGVMGLCMGCIDCLANLQMINIHGNAVAPFLHALHFCYGIGAFVSPMIAEPFLLNEDCSPFVDNDTTASLLAAEDLRLLAPPGTIVLNDTNLPADTLIEAQQMTRVRFAFWIMAAVQLPIPLLVASVAWRLKTRGWKEGHRELATTPTGSHHSLSSLHDDTGNDRHPHRRQQQQQQQSYGGNEYGAVTPTRNADSGQWSASAATPAATAGHVSVHLPYFLASRQRQLIAVAALTAAMLFIFDGLQSTYGGYVYSYAVKSIVDLNKTEGAYLNALFWGTFALGRLVSVLLATKFSPAFMLLCNIGGCLLSVTLMLLARHSHVILYLGTAMFGMFLSSVAPTSISLAESYIDVTSSVTSAIVVVAALGEMICPVIVGNTFVTLGPASLLVFAELLCILSVGVYAALWYLGRHTDKHCATSSENESFIWSRMCCIRRGAGAPVHTVQHVRYLRKYESECSSNMEMGVVSTNDVTT